MGSFTRRGKDSGAEDAYHLMPWGWGVELREPQQTGKGRRQHPDTRFSEGKHEDTGLVRSSVTLANDWEDPYKDT